jgi:hypothetical protein
MWFANFVTEGGEEIKKETKQIIHSNCSPVGLSINLV